MRVIRLNLNFVRGYIGINKMHVLNSDLLVCYTFYCLFPSQAI